MEQKEKVEELAETLKSKGLAASMVDALEKAKNIIYGIASKKEKPKIEEQNPNQKEESTEITNTSVDESNVIEKDNSEKIKEIETDTHSVNVKNDHDQQKLDEIKIEDNNYDISKEEKTVNEILGKEEDVFISSHESDNLLKEEVITSTTEQTPETITSIDESNSEEEPVKIEDIPGEKRETEQSKPFEEKEEEKPQLKEEEKKKTDLSKIFNFGNK